jgi:anti-sigma factor RsiW
VSCAQPIDATVLADYWVAALPETEEDAVEAHLFTCDECGARLREVIALAEGVRTLARGGCLRMVVSDAFLQRVAEDGLRIREHAPPLGGSYPCTVHADDDLLVVRMAASLSGAARVDLCVCDEHGVELLRHRDIPVHAEARSVIFQESIVAQKAAPSYTLIARMVAFDEAGTERVIGEYTLNHTRSPSLD